MPRDLFKGYRFKNESNLNYDFWTLHNEAGEVGWVELETGKSPVSISKPEPYGQDTFRFSLENENQREIGHARVDTSMADLISGEGFDLQASLSLLRGELPKRRPAKPVKRSRTFQT